MACGEHPQAADSVGINVYKMRWAGVLISGVARRPRRHRVHHCRRSASGSFEYGVAGFGFLSLAVMIFGQWKPPAHRAGGAAVRSVPRAVAMSTSALASCTALNIPSPRVQHDALHHLPHRAGLHLQALPRSRRRRASPTTRASAENPSTQQKSSGCDAAAAFYPSLSVYHACLARDCASVMPKKLISMRVP